MLKYVIKTTQTNKTTIEETNKTTIEETNKTTIEETKKTTIEETNNFDSLSTVYNSHYSIVQIDESKFHGFEI